MRKILIITVVLALLLVGCTQDVEVQKPTTTTDSVMTPTDAPTTPSNPATDSTEGAGQTTTTEPSEGSQEPHEIMPWDIEKQFNGFKFGHMGIAVKNRGYM
jgi:PBP1b-binding outer membrane lipoprotein LpoB